MRERIVSTGTGRRRRGIRMRVAADGLTRAAADRLAAELREAGSCARVIPRSGTDRGYPRRPVWMVLVNTERGEQ
jgi:hypothetical protein